MKINVSEKVLEFVTAVRVWLPMAPERFRAFVVSVREDPVAMLYSRGVRITGLLIAAFVSLLFVSCMGNWLYPTKGMGTPAALAPFRVHCVNTQCKFNGTIRLAPDFKKWPARCPKCKQNGLHPLLLCRNPKCQKYVIPSIQQDGSMRCPACGAPL